MPVPKGYEHTIGMLGMPSVVWMTDDVTLPREALGLTMLTIPCDRMECLYKVLDAKDCQPFLPWAQRNGHLWAGKLVEENKQPEHWFVSEKAVPVRRVK